MKSRIALLLAMASPLASTMPLLAQSPNPNEAYIQSITYGGTGCPQGSVGTSFANDRKSFTLIFDSFVASSGSGVPVTENRKNCQVNVNVRIPAGAGQFCTTFDYRGYVGLPAGVTGEQKSIYYFDGVSGSYELPDGQVIDVGGEPVTVEPEASTFVGPVSKDYLARDTNAWQYDLPAAAVRPININSQVRLSGNPTAQAQITTDSIDGKIVPCAEDTSGPTITISKPVLYGMYGLGANIAPEFTCEDAGSGVASCTGAATLDTSSVGPKTFTVTAIDNAGNTSTSSIAYAVGGKEECKGGGHGKFLEPAFKNQGSCVSTYSGKK